jgi:hypothetical protein
MSIAHALKRGMGWGRCEPPKPANEENGVKPPLNAGSLTLKGEVAHTPPYVSNAKHHLHNSRQNQCINFVVIMLLLWENINFKHPYRLEELYYCGNLYSLFQEHDVVILMLIRNIRISC